MFRRLARREARYPFADLPVWAKRAVLQAIVESFNDAIGTGVRFIDEIDLSAIIVDGLNELRRNDSVVPPFSAQLFQVVSRDGCSSTFDGSSLHKRPDMVFRLAANIDEYEGWFAECKIVDSDHRPGLYVSNGVHRFVAGEYGWAMPSALMLAYAGPGYTVERVAAIAGRCEASPLLADRPLVQSAHARTWTYPGTARAPGDVSIVHLWLHGAQFT